MAEKSIGAEIDRQLAASGLKTYVVATRMGISPDTFRAIRKGRRALAANEAQRLSEILDVPITTFLPETHE